MKRKTWPLIVLALGMTLGLAPASWGALIAYEGFDYPNDGPQLDERDGGIGWAAPWDEGSTVDFSHLTQNDISLDSPAFPFEPIGDHLAGKGGAIIRQFNQDIDMREEGNVLYVSTLIRKTQDAGDGVGGDNVEFGVGSSGTTNLVRVGSTTDERWFINFNGSTANFDPLHVGENYFVVLKLVSREATEDEAYVAVFGVDDIVPSLEPVTWDMAVTRLSNAQVDIFRLAMGTNATGAFDEIRIGETWSDVTRVPEPATWGLLAIGVIALGGACRRRK